MVNLISKYMSHSYDGTEQIVLTKGDVSDGNPIMVRVHVTDYFDNLFGNYGSDDASLHKAIKIIERKIEELLS